MSACASVAGPRGIAQPTTSADAQAASVSRAAHKAAGRNITGGRVEERNFAECGEGFTAMKIPTAYSKTPLDQVKGGSHCNLPDDVLLSRARCSLSSALKRFTVLFGMGRSGSTSLWSSGMTCRQQEGPASQSGKRSYRFQLLDRIAHFARGCDRTTQSSSADFLQSYRVKPHGQLVLVSLTCHHASTPSLSTSWSRTTLQGDLVPREISSLGEFPA